MALFQTNSAGTLKDETLEWRTFMRVSDVLKSNRQTLATCIPEESIVSICTRLSALNIGAFPVCDAHGTLVGIISERDVVRAFAKDGARLADRHVRDLMTSRGGDLPARSDHARGGEADAQASRSPFPGHGRRQARWHAFDPGHLRVAGGRNRVTRSTCSATR